MLNPDFVSNDIDVDDRPMHATLSIPADMQQLEVVLGGVNDSLRLNVAMGWLVAGIVEDKLTHDGAIVVYGIH